MNTRFNLIPGMFGLMLVIVSACGINSEDPTNANVPVVESAPQEATLQPTATKTYAPPAATRTDTPPAVVTPTIPAGHCGLGAVVGTPDPCALFGGYCPDGLDRCQHLAASVQGWRADFPPSQGNASCDSASNYAQPDDRLLPDASEVLDVVVVYEGSGAEHGPCSGEQTPGVVEVVVRPRTKPVVLALGAYEQVRWRLLVEPGAQLSRVITQGYNTQEVEGVPDGVPVVHRSPEQFCTTAYAWEIRHGGGPNFALMIADLRELTGLIESSFQGCYSSARFEVPYWTGEPPTQHPTPIAGDESLARNEIDFPGCEEVTGESEYCLTGTYAGLAVLGLDSGQLCHVTDSTVPLNGSYLASLAWRGEMAYACSSAGLIRISLRDGSWESAEVPCGSIADVEGGLLLTSSSLSGLFGPGGLHWYPDYQAVLNGSSECTYNLGWGSESMTAHGSRWYGAWHATDSLTVGDFDATEPIGVLTLEDFNDWVWSMTATDAGHLVIGNGRESVSVFDAQTGRKLRELPVAEPVAGLACTSRQESPNATPTPAVQPQIITPNPTPAPRPAALPSCDSLAQSIALPGQQANYAPSLAIEKNCVGGYGSSNYASDTAELDPDASHELHVISVGDGKGNPGFRDQRQGTVTVNVAARPKPIVLVLSAYESMLWRLNVEPDAQLARVILQGSAPQFVEGAPGGTEVIYRGPEDFCASSYGWEIWHGGNALMIADIRAYTGLVETSFQGCYSGAEFDVPYWTGEPPTAKPTPLVLNESIPREQVQFPGCEAVTQEHTYCLTTTYGGVALVGLDTGNVCALENSAPIGGVPDVSSIAWRGEAAYACGHGVGLVRFSLVDGRTEIAQVSCEAVTDDGTNLLLGSSPFSHGLAVYPTYAAVLTGDPSVTYDVGWDTRMTEHNGRLYSAWHSTNTVNVFDLATNQPLPPITLDDYDGWILGMAVTDANKLVISGDSWGDTIRIFDLATGMKVRELRPSMPVSGLACVSSSGQTPTPTKIPTPTSHCSAYYSGRITSPIIHPSAEVAVGSSESVRLEAIGLQEDRLYAEVNGELVATDTELPLIAGRNVVEFLVMGEGEVHYWHGVVKVGETVVFDHQQSVLEPRLVCEDEMYRFQLVFNVQRG